ncbi:venom metalloproteinase antarease TserMP_A-like [Dermacentor silvarum]|uniref:venom metalloproteinase antarease TserMP_A-like n=1 Tax=Dermacentor silvarum TaxID=543639 RepID=UPI002101C8F1|nr:venom metalloproteinase antarease TserMP_A-like [Dermacentor silvarum]
MAHEISRINAKPGTCESANRKRSEPDKEPTAPVIESRTVPSHYTVEVHFITDLKHNSYFGEQTEDRVAYAMLFMHSVSLRLQQLEPPVRIGLAAVEGLKTNPSYMKLYPDGDLIGDRTLDDLIQYVNNNEVPKKSDLVYMSTGLDIKYGTDPSKYVSLAGITTTGQACRKDKVAIGQDTPDTFSGVQTAAHEIAHLLGAPHDGEGDAKNCSSQDGYIMSTHEGGKNGLTFSDCTKKAVAQFFEKPGSECLRKEILCYVISLPNKAADLPGDVMDGPTFCSKYYPKGKYKSSTYIKVDSDLNRCLFRCLVESKRLPRRAMNVTPFAVDGTPCSQSEPRKVCKSRICVEP